MEEMFDEVYEAQDELEEAVQQVHLKHQEQHKVIAVY